MQSQRSGIQRSMKNLDNTSSGTSTILQNSGKQWYSRKLSKLFYVYPIKVICREWSCSHYIALTDCNNEHKKNIALWSINNITVLIAHAKKSGYRKVTITPSSNIQDTIIPWLMLSINLSCSALSLFSPTNPICCIRASVQICTYNAKSVSCWTTMIRSSHLTILKFGSKVPLKKLGHLSLRRGPWQFWIWLRGLVSLKLASRCLKDNGKNKQWQQLDQNLCLCLLAMKRFWSRRQRLCLASLKYVTPSCHLQGLVHCRLHYWTMEIMIRQMTCPQFKEECLLLNSH